jgi:hypothetical protein
MAFPTRVPSAPMGTRGTARLVAVAALVAAALAATPSPPAAADDGLLWWPTSPLEEAEARSDPQCGPEDLPEGPLQGHVPKADQDSRRAERGYNCGLALLGHTRLGAGGRPDVNANMAWAGRCAYVASSAGISVAPQVPSDPPPGAGVAVVRVADDGTPDHVTTLRGPAAAASAETLHAVTTPEGRSILVVGRYGNDVLPAPKPMDVYDVSEPHCDQPRLLTTFQWPENTHNLTLSQDGRYVFATQPLQVADLAGLWDDEPATGVRYLGNLGNALPGPPVAVGPTANADDVLPRPVRELTHPFTSSHEAWPSADGRTLYVGGVTAGFEVLSIVDVSRWLERGPDGRPAGRPRVVSQRAGRGHSVRTATIGGRPYLLHSDEAVFGLAYGCLPQAGAPFAGTAQPWLTDIDDPAHPKTAAHFGLEVNAPAHCVDQIEAGENSSVHYHDVDDPEDTTFVMASMWNAGVRIFDVRDPSRPTEVAYFNPGDVDRSARTVLDQAWGHVRWVPERGQLWFATASGGFWVVGMEQQVREHLGLDGGPGGPTGGSLTRGRPGTVGVRLGVVPALAGLAPAYCTIGSATGGLVPVVGLPAGGRRT